MCETDKDYESLKCKYCGREPMWHDHNECMAIQERDISIAEDEDAV